jgi:hypothetical protein
MTGKVGGGSPVRLGAAFLDFAFFHRFDLVNELHRA